MSQMKAVVIHEAGGPEVLRLEGVGHHYFEKLQQQPLTPTQRPIPTPQPGWVLIRVKACGLNRSEMFTRQGHSPNVEFPRILGIEATGIVEKAPLGEFQEGDVVATRGRSC